MYHVVIEVNPYDYMGNRAYDRAFEDLPSALTYYQSIFAQDSSILPEIAALYWPDQEDIYEVIADDASMIISGNVYLVFSSIDIGTMKEVDGYETDAWINDYDNLVKDDHITYLIDLYKSVQAKTISRYDFEFDYTEDIVRQCDEHQKKCCKSAEKIIEVSITNERKQGKYIPQYLTYDGDRVAGCDYSTDLLRWLHCGSSQEQYEEKVSVLQKELDSYNQTVEYLWSIPGFPDFFDQNNACVTLKEIETRFGADCMTAICSIRASHYYFPDLCCINGYFFSRSVKFVGKFVVDGLNFEMDIQNFLIDVFKQDKYYCAYSDTEDSRDFCYSLAWHFSERGLLKNVNNNVLCYLEMEWQDDCFGSSEQKAICYLVKLLKSRGYLKEYFLMASNYQEIWAAYTEREDNGVIFYMLDRRYLKDKLLCERINCLLSNLYVYDEEGERDPNAPLYDAAIDEDNLDIPFYFLQDKNDKMYISRTPGKFGGHIKQRIYGHMDCPSAARYLKKGQYVQNRVFFADEETAIAAGYRPCAKCMREAYKKWKESQA